MLVQFVCEIISSIGGGVITSIVGVHWCDGGGRPLAIGLNSNSSNPDSFIVTLTRWLVLRAWL